VRFDSKRDFFSLATIEFSERSDVPVDRSSVEKGE
jgi:hypothetical protein